MRPLSPNTHLNPAASSWWHDIFLISFILGSLFLILLGTKPLFVPDEGRYAEIAREMAESNQYLTPYLNYIKYFEKPPLFYWLTAAAIKIGGVNVWSVRCINALLGLMGCLATYATARLLYNRLIGLLAAFILGTSTLYFVMVHMVSLDLPVTVFLSISLYCFLLGKQAKTNSIRRRYYWAATANAAFAVMTKGLIGLVFPIAIIGTWFTLLKDWKHLKYAYIPSCFLIFLLIAAPWHILVGYYNPEFFYFYFIEQHFLRYATHQIGHYQPAWFFIPIFVISFFPWIVFFPQTLSHYAINCFKNRKTYSVELFLLLWIGIIFTFFSFSHSKLIPYILPIFPPCAILTARYLLFANDKKHSLSLLLSCVSLLLFSMIIAIVFYQYTTHTVLPNAHQAMIYLGIASIILILGVLISILFIYVNIYKTILSLIITQFIFLLLILVSIPAIDNRSILSLAEGLKPIINTHDEVISYNRYYQDLPFYLERKIAILNWQNELTFGMKHQHIHDWMIDDALFWKRFNSQKRIFVFIPLKDYEKLIENYPDKVFYLWDQTKTNALISNQAKIN